jgi:hypothetical protein
MTDNPVFDFRNGRRFISSPYNAGGLSDLIRTPSQWKQRTLPPELELLAREIDH